MTENRLLLDETVVNLLLRLVGEEIRHVYADFIDVDISWAGGHFHLSPASEVAVTQNASDELITIAVTRGDGPYEPNRPPDVVLADRKLTAIWAAETVVYFSDSVTYSAAARGVHRLRYLARRLSWLISGRPKADGVELTLQEVVSQSVSGHDEIVAHPDRMDELRLLEVPLNLVQAGIVFDFEGECLPVFSNHNGYGFPISDVDGLRSWSALKAEFGEFYRFARLTGDTTKRAFA